MEILWQTHEENTTYDLWALNQAPLATCATRDRILRRLNNQAAYPDKRFTPSVDSGLSFALSLTFCQDEGHQARHSMHLPRDCVPLQWITAADMPPQTSSLNRFQAQPGTGVGGVWNAESSEVFLSSPFFVFLHLAVPLPSWEDTFRKHPAHLLWLGRCEHHLSGVQSNVYFNLYKVYKPMLFFQFVWGFMVWSGFVVR